MFFTRAQFFFSALPLLTLLHLLHFLFFIFNFFLFLHVFDSELLRSSPIDSLELSSRLAILNINFLLFFFVSDLLLFEKKWDDLAATGLSVLARANFVKSVMDQKPMAGPLLWMGSGHSSVIILSLLGMLRLAKFLAVETLMMICFKVPIPLPPPNNMISSNCFLLF